jgi:hypothetical protein
VTAALFAIELIEKPNTERSELVSKASKLLSEASGQLKPEENLRFADAVNAGELLRAHGRVEEAKAWSDRIVKEPITDKLLTALKVVGLRTGLTTIASRVYTY